MSRHWLYTKIESRGCNGVTDLFESEFPKASQRKENVIRHLLDLSESHNSYLWSDLCQECEIPQPTMSYWLKFKQPHFSFIIYFLHGKVELFYWTICEKYCHVYGITYRNAPRSYESR